MEKDVVEYELEMGIRILEKDNICKFNGCHEMAQCEALTDCASSVSISHIRSEWNANNSESSSNSHACSSWNGLCRYCSTYSRLTF